MNRILSGALLAWLLASTGTALAQSDITDFSGGIITDKYSVTGVEGNAKITDNNIYSKYLTFNATTWVRYQSPVSSVVTSYAVTSANDAVTRDPKNWTFEGSNDGTNWTVLHSATNQVFINRWQRLRYNFSNSTAYTYFRLNITANSGATIVQLAEWEIFGTGTGSPLIPAGPSALSGTGVSGNQIILNWTDNSSTETAMRIERSPNNTTWSLLRVAPANTTQLRDTGLNGGSYYYRVRAENSSGNSAYTTSAQITAPANDFPLTWQEHWFEHNQVVTKKYSDSDVGIYFDSDMNSSINWMDTTVSKAWKYTKQVYGGFSDKRLYAVFHQNKYGGGSPATYIDADRDYRNAICLGQSNPWTSNTGWNLDATIHEIGHIVEGAAFGVKNSPAFPIWGDSKWCVIYQYDLYYNLGWTAEATRWYNSAMATTDSYPRANTNWFRDWFYPIWNNYGHSTALKNYFQLLSQYFIKRNDIYSRNLNFGEFVHFWSGAAGVNLKSQATTAFGWTADYEAQFNQARIDYPFTYPDMLAADVTELQQLATDSSAYISLQKPAYTTDKAVLGEEVKVWPNPSENKRITIGLQVKDGIVPAQIYNAQGHCVYFGNLQGQTTINLANQPAGTYFILLQVRKSKIARKIILQ
ncbi:T9SS type A sorting domain-containing protein [Chitinophaga sp. sic0106]|uniref:T9SS type A sorting domain-containing protein n=1 Tax=Chitinophaga sp. sic0106 TaxID=2854785 RepID=UPI001C4402D9|nr:T9SS type A sorting domain-containing protein [Chitinophaga sp. sic0106]MBV7529759.1 T9SS type A sorting domain-containing protein [Chitinophaga sp. sic0106]